MGFITENFTTHHVALDRLDAITTLTKLLLKEIESMRHSSSAGTGLTDGIARKLTEDVQQYEASLICKALFETRGNRAKAAIKLGVKNTTLHFKIRKYNIDPINPIGSESVTDRADQEKLMDWKSSEK